MPCLGSSLESCLPVQPHPNRQQQHSSTSSIASSSSSPSHSGRNYSPSKGSHQAQQWHQQLLLTCSTLPPPCGKLARGRCLHSQYHQFRPVCLQRCNPNPRSRAWHRIYCSQPRGSQEQLRPPLLTLSFTLMLKQHKQLRSLRHQQHHHPRLTPSCTPTLLRQHLCSSSSSSSMHPPRWSRLSSFPPSPQVVLIHTGTHQPACQWQDMLCRQGTWRPRRQ